MATSTKSKLKTKTKRELTSSSRFYTHPTLGNLPSVTTILSNTESDNARNRLEKWGRDWDADPLNQGKMKPSERGSFVDSILTSYFKTPLEIRVKPKLIGLPEDVLPYIESLNQPLQDGSHILDKAQEMYWAQGLLVDIPDCQRLWKTSAYLPPQEYVASTKGWAGVPDFIGVWNNKLSLISLKTSDKLYFKSKPDWKDVNEKKKRGEPPSPQWSAHYSGWCKYNKARMQEAAYKIAIEETLGLYVESVVILVITPKKVQTFTLTPNEIENATHDWMDKVDMYKSMVA